MIAKPDLSTFQLVPWRQGERPVARLFCDILQPDGTPYPGDTRFAFKRLLARAREKGYTFFVGPELEYFYFADNGEPGFWMRAVTLTPVPWTWEATCDAKRFFALQSMDIRVEYSHHEVAPSQHEIDLRYAEGLKMADMTMTYRIVVKEIARSQGVYATFMPKPVFGINGSGMHTHQSLFLGTKNAFLIRRILFTSRKRPRAISPG